MANEKQSNLERIGIDERQEQLARGEARYDISRNEAYGPNHDKARSHDDANHPWGKGTGGSHTHYLPDQSLPKTLYNYSNFNTTEQAGGSYDKYGRNGVGGRNFLRTISLYNSEKPYGKQSVDIDTTIEGQYFVQ